MDAMAPRGVWVTAGFFVVAGVLELAAAIYDARPLAFWPLWDGFFRAAPHFALALGLWRRKAFCRSVAMVYCLAVLATYAAVLAMALAHAPVDFPDTVKLQSLIQVPSCSLLFPYLRSHRGSELFPKALFHP
jgi:hypothetical protein